MYIYIQVVQREHFDHEQWTQNPPQPIEFAAGMIELDIPLEGIRLKNGWTINPLMPGGVPSVVSTILYYFGRNSQKVKNFADIWCRSSMKFHDLLNVSTLKEVHKFSGTDTDSQNSEILLFEKF